MLSCFSKSDQENYKKGIVNAILATDMIHHNPSIDFLRLNKSEIVEGKLGSDKSSVRRG